MKYNQINKNNTMIDILYPDGITNDAIPDEFTTKRFCEISINENFNGAIISKYFIDRNTDGFIISI